MANTLEENHGTRTPEIKAIKSSSKYMLALVSDVLDLGRFEAGRVILENLTVDIHALLETNLACAAQMAETHKILFESYVDPAIPTWLSVDPIRLQQILNNFISNAFKFTPKGGRIRVEVRAVKIFRGPNPLASADAVPVSLSCRDTLLKRQRSASIAPTPRDDTMASDDEVATGETSFDPSQAAHLKTMMRKSKRGKWQKLIIWKKPRGGSPVLPDIGTARDDLRGRAAGKRPASGGGVGENLGGARGVGGVRTSVEANSTLANLQPLTYTGSGSSRLGRITSFESSNAGDFTNDLQRTGSGESSSSSSSNPPVYVNIPSLATSSIHSSTIFDATETFPPTRSASDASVVSGIAEDRREGEQRREREDGEQGRDRDREEGRRAEGERGEREEREGEWVMLEVSVSDTGIGIDPAIVSKLFRPYAQAAVSTMREYGGSGLGLAITNQIVRLMGGTVNVETEVGKGSKFTFVVPLAIVSSSSKTSEPCPPPEILYPVSPVSRAMSETHVTPVLHTSPTDGQASGSHADSPNEEGPSRVFKILIVDDSGMNRNILSSMINRILKKGLYSIDIATNGQEAVEICDLHKGDEEFDLIFMDIVMPIMDGMEASRQIRAKGYSKHIVVTTANQVTGAAAKAEMTEAGASEAISKPFSKNYISALLTKYGAGFAVNTTVNNVQK